MVASKETKFCVTHAPEGMVNVRSARCGRAGCNKLPIFGVSSTKKAQFCSPHAWEGMVGVVQRRCNHPGCKKLSCNGVSGSSKELCSRHVQDGTVKIGTRCI